MPLEKPKLFPEKKAFMCVVSILLFLILVRLFFVYHSYQNFITKPFYYTYATVLNAYEKQNNVKRYQVLKVKSDEGLTFYTTSYKKENFYHKRLRLQIFPSKEISFKDYLGTFYVKSKIKYQEKLPYTLKDRLLQKVSVQHESTALPSFYNAIFFATSIDQALRAQIAQLGISHLVALSGFHLGILWALVYGIVGLLYRPLQQRFFPYRHALFDVGVVAIWVLGMYVWFVDFPPSLLRAFAMVLVGWVVLLLGMALLSFTFLTSVMLTLIALFPSLLVSLSFWLSVAGVFYIFLLLQYTQHLNRWLISLVLIPLGIFILMLPVVHGIFAVTSTYQLLSPVLSILFVVFYPLMMVLHLLGLGALFDAQLLWLFDLPTQSVESLLPWWVVLIYVGVSLLAIWYRSMFYIVLGLAGVYTVYLFL